MLSSIQERNIKAQSIYNLGDRHRKTTLRPRGRNYLSSFYFLALIFFWREGEKGEISRRIGSSRGSWFSALGLGQDLHSALYSIA